MHPQAQRVDSMAAGATQSPGHRARSMPLLGNPELYAKEDVLALQASQNQPGDEAEQEQPRVGVPRGRVLREERLHRIRGQVVQHVRSERVDAEGLEDR